MATADGEGVATGGVADGSAGDVPVGRGVGIRLVLGVRVVGLGLGVEVGVGSVVRVRLGVGSGLGVVVDDGLSTVKSLSATGNTMSEATQRALKR